MFADKKVNNLNGSAVPSNSCAKCNAMHFFKVVFSIPSSTDFNDLKTNLKGVNGTLIILLKSLKTIGSCQLDLGGSPE